MPPAVVARVWDFTPQCFTKTHRWAIIAASLAVMTGLYFTPLPRKPSSSAIGFRGALPVFHVPDIHHAIPWLASLTQALSRGFDQTMSVATSAALIALALRRYPRLTVAVLLLFPLKSAIGADTLGNFVYQVATGELSLLVHALLVIYVWRFNPLVMFGAYVSSSLLGAIFLFLEKGGPAYRCDGLILVALLAAVIGVFWRYGTAPRGQNASCA